MNPAPGQVHAARIQCGLDLGKIQDYSHLAVTGIETAYVGLKHIGNRPSYIDRWGNYQPAEPIQRQEFRTMFTVRYLEAFPLRTPYELVAARCGDIFQALSEAHHSGVAITLYLDYTGVGIGVAEIVSKHLSERAGVSHMVRVQPITLTGGTSPYRPGSPTCSKFALVSNLLKLMGARVPELLIPGDLQDMAATIDELRAYQERLSKETGNASYDGRPGVHDDRVISLGLSALPPLPPVTYSSRVY